MSEREEGRKKGRDPGKGENKEMNGFVFDLCVGEKIFFFFLRKRDKNNNKNNNNNNQEKKKKKTIAKSPVSHKYLTPSSFHSSPSPSLSPSPPLSPSLSLSISFSFSLPPHTTAGILSPSFFINNFSRRREN